MATAALAACLGAPAALAQPGAAHAPSTPSAPSAPPTRPASTPAAPSSSWNGLSPAQQHALAPMAVHWDGLRAEQKRKWLALSRNFAKMSPAEQATLQSRMAEWAALSPAQRTQARLNYAEIKRLPANERKAQWEAYQALSETEKRTLAERAGTRSPSVAAPVRPVPAQKLAPTPSGSSQGKHPPRIELAPRPAARHRHGTGTANSLHRPAAPSS